MKFYIYSIYDPEVESFDSRLNLGPLGPEEMAEQYRRANLKMKKEDALFMEGKKAIFMGTFDDTTGKIEQTTNLLEIYHYKKDKKESSQVEEKGESEMKVDG